MGALAGKIQQHRKAVIIAAIVVVAAVGAALLLAGGTTNTLPGSTPNAAGPTSSATPSAGGGSGSNGGSDGKPRATVKPSDPSLFDGIPGNASSVTEETVVVADGKPADTSTWAPPGSYDPASGSGADTPDAELPPGWVTSKRAASDPLPPVSIAKTDQLVDITDGLIRKFATSLQAFQPAEDYPAITAVRDDCLVAYATKNLPDLDGKSLVGTVDICGSETAVIYGGYTTSANDLLLHARDKKSDSDVKSILWGATSIRYAAVASESGHAVMLLVARG